MTPLDGSLIQSCVDNFEACKIWDHWFYWAAAVVFECCYWLTSGSGRIGKVHKAGCFWDIAGTWQLMIPSKRCKCIPVDTTLKGQFQRSRPTMVDDEVDNTKVMNLSWVSDSAMYILYTRSDLIFWKCALLKIRGSSGLVQWPHADRR